MVFQKYFPELSKQQLSKFNDLKEICLEWNKKINVISRKDTDEFEIRHVLHSLSIAKFVQFNAGCEILDFGTGGGFPGIPLAIYFPEAHFTLVDSIGKKMKVVQEITESLELSNVNCKVGRVEHLKEKFDFVTCRAVGRVGKIYPWVKNSVKAKSLNSISNGFIFLKGGDLKEELSEANISFKRLPIKNYFTEVFFESKEIVYLPYQKK